MDTNVASTESQPASSSENTSCDTAAMDDLQPVALDAPGAAQGIPPHVFEKWSLLPTEIQLEILKLALGCDTTLYLRSDRLDRQQYPEAMCPLLECGNLELAEMTKDAFYKSTTLLLFYNRFESKKFGVYNYRRLDLRPCHNLTVDMYCTPPHSRGLIDTNSVIPSIPSAIRALDFLLNPDLLLSEDTRELKQIIKDGEERDKRFGCLSHRKQLTKLFPNVKILTVKITLVKYDANDPRQPSCLAQRFVEFLRTNENAIEIPLAPVQLNFSIFCEDCWGGVKHIMSQWRHSKKGGDFSCRWAREAENLLNAAAKKKIDG